VIVIVFGVKSKVSDFTNLIPNFGALKRAGLAVNALSMYEITSVYSYGIVLFYFPAKMNVFGIKKKGSTWGVPAVN
jgi:hypothetical protein